MICQPSQPVEHEEHEEKEAAMNVKIETYEPPARIEESIDVHDTPETVPALERPTTLTFGKQEMATVDTISLLSPISPISKQVRWSTVLLPPSIRIG